MKRFIPAMFILFIVMFSRAPSVFAAPRLALDPSSKTILVNQTYETRVTIDVEGNQAFGADAIILYPQNDIEITNIQSGGFFPDFSPATADGRIELHGFFANLFDTKSGSGTLATFTVKALTNSGDGRLTFVCSGNQATQILDQDGNNILSCSNLNSQTITFVSPSDTPTQTPTKIPTVTRSPTPQPTIPGTNPSSTPVKSATPSRTPTKTSTRTPTKSPTPRISSSPTKTPSRTPTPPAGGSPTPQEAVFTLIKSPTPTPAQPRQESEPFDPIRWFLGLGVVGTSLIIGGYFFFKGLRDSRQPPPLYEA